MFYFVFLFHFQVELRGSPAVHLDMIVLFCFFLFHFQVELRGSPAADLDRQRGGGAREREDREAHHEEHPGWTQPLHLR